MSEIHASLQSGLAAFNQLLEAEYGKPIGYWAQMPKWSDAESLQISRALAVLMKQPIADAAIADAGSNETGALRHWTISDAKIAGPEFETSWQYALLADIENGREKEPGQMAVPADPRRFVIFISYERGFFSILADHLFRLLCDRVKLPAFSAPFTADQPPCEEAVTTANLLRQVPGLETADASFIAGLVFLISKTGPRGFEDWCDERGTAQSDERL